MSKNDMVKESNNLIIIVVLSLFLILSLGYIAYDKYFSKIVMKDSTEEKTTEKETSEESTKYNKDGYFIQNLMDGIVYKSGIDHNEYQLYLKDKVTVDDLEDFYRDTLVQRNVGKDYFTTSEFEKASKVLFGKNVYKEYPKSFTGGCKLFVLKDNKYSYDMEHSGGCGGSGYRYYDMIKNVKSDKDHIYVYQVVGFESEEGICKDIEEIGKYSNVVMKVSPNTKTHVDMNELADKLHTYKFTFTYDKTNNIYYFEKVEKES